MPIAGVVVLTKAEEAMNVLEALKKFDNVTTYGVHKENNIIAVLEAEETKSLEKISQKISSEISGILGIYPAYVNFEDEMNPIEETGE